MSSNPILGKLRWNEENIIKWSSPLKQNRQKIQSTERWKTRFLKE